MNTCFLVTEGPTVILLHLNLLTRTATRIETSDTNPHSTALPIPQSTEIEDSPSWGTQGALTDRGSPNKISTLLARIAGSLATRRTWLCGYRARPRPQPRRQQITPNCHNSSMLLPSHYNTTFLLPPRR